MTKVTYVPPDEPGHPDVLKWNGVTFPANMPVELDPAKHSYLVPIVEKWTDPTSGEVRSKATEKLISMVEMAKTNPSFRVDGEMQVRRLPGRPRIPRTSEEYRGHAMAWIAAAETIEDLEKWEAEEQLRRRCDVGDEDISYLRPFYDAKHHELTVEAS
jgi:hypothetical protein